MSSSSPVRTPKLQLATEQPLTGECWIPPKKDIPHPSAKEKPQQNGRRGEIVSRIKPHTHRDAWRAQTKPCMHQETPQRLSQICLGVFECLLQRYGSAVACHRGRGSGCSRPGYGISPLGGGQHYSTIKPPLGRHK